MKKLILISIAMLLFAGMLLAQPMPKANVQVGPCANDNPNMKARLTDDGTGMDRMMDLNLSDVQKKKLGDLRAIHQKAMNILDAEIENLNIDLRQAIMKDDFSTARKATQSLFEKKLAKATARLDHMEMVLKELTPEQKDKCRQMFMEMMDNDGPMGMKMQGHKAMMGQMKGNCKDMPMMQGQMKCPGCKDMPMMQGQTMKDEMKCPDCMTMDQSKAPCPGTMPPPKDINKTPQPK